MDPEQNSEKQNPELDKIPNGQNPELDKVQNRTIIKDRESQD